MVHWNNDYIYGTEKQKEILPVIKEYFSRDIIETEGQYSKFDFEDDEYNYELKSRKNTINKYPDTMITLNKLKDDDKPLILLFNFTNCLAYIKYDKELFKSFKTANFSRAKMEWDKKIHIYIPIKYLNIIGE